MKRAQVAQMNQIYSRAYLTLVAAAGSDASYGLPGIRSRPRRPLQRVVLNNIAIIRMLPHTSAQTFRSTWASRGWTYQECFLSTRRLIFTEHEVSYLCNTMDHAETVNKPLSNSRLRERVSDAKFLELIPSQDSLNGVSGKLKELRWNQLKQKQLPNYTKRQLSKTSDTIDAARGLFHALENSKIRHFYGIPFRQIDARNRSRYIFSLAWHHQEVAKRNLPFPSWSWAGWVGGIQMSEPDFCSSDDQEIEIEKEDGSTMPLQDWFCGQEQSPISEIRNGPQVLGISAMTVWVNFARRSWTGLNEKSGVQSQIVGMTFASGDYAVLPIREGLTAWCYAYMDWDNVPLEAGLLGLVLQTKQQKRYSILLLRKSGDHHERVGLVRVHSWNSTRAATDGDSENSDPAIIYTDTEGTPLDNVAISDERPLWLQEAVKRTIWIS
ncbi:tol protein [Colletotrichum chrysophilum]|uniref:Tol protein n=1 Tax=Colletotrichum chrysophilum TaxID=1836956 RepID=A0AAD9ED96_9PEZI|nr:tol protein [Colletotrichum chrysophilum]